MIDRILKETGCGIVYHPKRIGEALGSVDRLGPLVGLLGGIELADQRVDVAAEFVEKGYLVPGATIAFGHQDGIDQDWHDQAFRVVQLPDRTELGERLAPRRHR